MSVSNTPWSQPIGKKPPNRASYGYIDDRGGHDSTREELIELLSRGRYESRPLIWTPESDFIVTPAEPAELRDAFRSGLRRRAFRPRPRFGAMALIAFGILTALLFGVTLRSEENAGLYAMFGVLLVIGGLARELLPRYRDYVDSRLDAERLAEDEAAAARHESWVQSQSTYAAAVLALALFVVFAFQLPWREASVRAAGFDAVAIRSGEWWRLFTSPLLHANYFHIAANVAAISFAGERIEAHLHRAYLPLVFLVGALYGGLASLLVMHDHRPMVGASGGAVALVGFLLVFAWRNQERLPRAFGRSLVAGLVLTAIVGAVGYKIIGNAAHAGGLIAGGLMGLLVIPRNAEVQPGKAVIVTGMGAAAMVGISGIVAITQILRAAF